AMRGTRRGLARVALRYLPVAAIMLLALTLRLMRPDVAELKLDEVQPLELAAQVWCDHRLPVTRGLTSFGLPGTPGVGYLLVLPRALSADPQVSVAFMGLLGSLTVLATYLTVRAYGGERLGLVSAALLAASPWAVFLSRKTWSQVQPLFTVLFLWALYQVVVCRRPAWALAFFPLLALQVQTHPVAIFYLPALLLTVAISWPRWRTRHALWGALIGALILSPYLLWLARHWGSTRATLLRQAGSGLTVDGRALLYALWFASGKTVTALMGSSVALLRPWEQALAIVNVLTAVLILWAVAACAWTAWRRRPHWESSALLLIWVGGPLLPLIVRPGEMGIHYLLLVVPAVFVLAGVGWACLPGSSRRLVRGAALVALLAVLSIQAGAVLAVYDGVVRHPTDGGFGRPLRHWREVQRGVLAEVARGEWRELQVLGTDEATWSSERSVLDYLLGRSVALRYVGHGGRAGVLVPHEGDALALVMAASDEMSQALGACGSELARWPAVGSDWGVRLYRLRGQDPSALMAGITPAPLG
ncbi:MAG: glycosyltransferase family 39 protein, partial [Anaerolineae bacterium]|nr:glycosyltransferase family 39 protein [Anaerolineae bacterium]